MNKYKLTKRDSRYYYFNNENGEVLKSPTHCYDADKICMPNHKRDKEHQVQHNAAPDAQQLILFQTGIPPLAAW